MSEASRRRRARGRGLATAILSVAGHVAALAVLLSSQPTVKRAVEPEPMEVALVQPPPPPPPPPTPPEAPPAPKTPEPAAPKPSPEPPPRRIAARPPRTRPPDAEPLPAGKPSSAEGTDELSESQVASAATADTGGGGGGRGCNMTRWIQSRLRKDPLVQAAAAEAHKGRAILIWNGDWIRHGSQDGAGLAAVREAVMWEVAFAPVECRNEPVRGFVLISLADSPGSPRIAMGSSQWRWSDLLGRGHGTVVQR